MKFQKIYPVAALAPFVRYYWYFEIDADELPFSQLSFPYGSFELICYIENPNLMRWGGTVEDFYEPDIFYAGQLTKPFTMTFNKKCWCIGASLQPWAGSHLYGTPSNEFTNQLVPLDLLDNDTGLYDQLKQCNDKAGLFRHLEAYLLLRFCKKQNDAMVRELALHIINDPTAGALKRNIAGIGLSRRRIEQRFIQSTGLSTGTFMRKIRFQKAVNLVKDVDSNLNFTKIGLQAGYYDQAHFISDFKSFSGFTPKAFSNQTTELNTFFKTMMPVG